MKNLNRKLGALAAAAVLTCGSMAVAAETVVTSTTTSAGTISEFNPDSNMIVIRSETAPQPLRYTFRESTTYVDETGAPVSRELVKSGLPVTVHYIKEGDKMIANRVVVRRTTTTTAPAKIEQRTTTTTAPAPIIEERKTKTTTTTTE